jgi:hypothetical protein
MAANLTIVEGLIPEGNQFEIFRVFDPIANGSENNNMSTLNYSKKPGFYIFTGYSYS